MIDQQIETLGLGTYRPIYLWAGPGTRRMNRLKFMNALVDDKIHDLAHSEAGAERIAAMGFNWVYLTCNWGFPPEIEEPDWHSFAQAVQIYHKLGIKVSGYVQSSNCAYLGSFKDKDWYALDPHGHKIHYYTGRYMTCLNHQGWRDQVKERVKFIIETGADGVFWDNPWVGGVGEEWRGAIVGNIGCYHPESQKAYQAACGEPIPLVLDLKDPRTQHYLQWRGEQVTAALQDWADYARSLKPDVLISANNFDTFNRNALVEVGMDFPAMAQVQDVMLIENFAMPRLLSTGGVVSNAAVIGAAQQLANDKPVSTVTYEHGIGFETVWSARVFARNIAEASAMNAPLVVKGTEFLYRKSFTLLIHHRYRPQHQMIQQYNDWLAEHAGWISDRQPTSPLAIYHPYQAMLFDRARIEPYFYGACETLFYAGLPFRIVGQEQAWDCVRTLIVPPGTDPVLDERLIEFAKHGGKIIPLGQGRADAMRPLWTKYHRQWLKVPRWKAMRRTIRRVTGASWEAYHNFRVVRRVTDWLDIPGWILSQSLYRLPPAPLRGDLVNAIGTGHLPYVESEGPVLLTMGQETNGRTQYHIVNYDDVPRTVTLHLPELTQAEVYTPGQKGAPTHVAGTDFILQVDVAKVLRTV